MLLTPTEQAFITAHLAADVRALALQRPPGVDVPKVVGQIQARQKARTKLPTWYANPDLIFPPPLSVEQASSERAAAYKASLLRESLPESPKPDTSHLLDLTGGMGVDTAAFARRIERVTYVEQQPAVAAAAAHNFQKLGFNNIAVQVGDGLTYLDTLAEPADWLYIDPARRDSRADRIGGRVVNLADCEPDVLTYMPRLLAKGRHVLIKAAPLLDIDAALRQLPACVAVHIVAVQGEVKELLFVLSGAPLSQGELPAARTATGQVQLVAVDLRDDGAVCFAFQRDEETNATLPVAEPATYLYEPNAAVLKAGAFRLVGQRFGLAKLAPHSHLYTANEPITNFPGRAFRIEAVCKADRKTLLTYVPSGQANLTVRNFPQPVEVVRKQLALREGGDVYIFATTLRTGDKRLIIARKFIGEPLNLGR